MPVLRSERLRLSEGEQRAFEAQKAIWRLLLIREGSARARAAWEEYALTPGSILILPPQTELILTPEGEAALLCLEMDEQIVLARDEVFLIQDDEVGTGRAMLEILAYQIQARPENYENVVWNQLNALRQFLLPRIDQERNLDILQLERLIQQNAGNPGFRLLEAMEQIPRSPSYTQRIFRAAFGCSPQAYLLDLRIRIAKNLLRTYDLTISETAHMCGFADPKYFARRFRQATGMTPTQFHRLAREAGQNPESETELIP